MEASRSGISGVGIVRDKDGNIKLPEPAQEKETDDTEELEDGALTSDSSP